MQMNIDDEEVDKILHDQNKVSLDSIIGEADEDDRGTSVVEAGSSATGLKDLRADVERPQSGRHEVGRLTEIRPLNQLLDEI